jgi:hypothetical protein
MLYALLRRNMTVARYCVYFMLYRATYFMSMLSPC